MISSNVSWTIWQHIPIHKINLKLSENSSLYHVLKWLSAQAPTVMPKIPSRLNRGYHYYWKYNKTFLT